MANNTSGYTGYNATAVTDSVKGVIRAYNKLFEALSNESQSFINEMGRYWACEQAQEFFNQAFKPSTDELIKDVNTTYESVVSTMNFYAQKYDDRMKGPFTPIKFNPAIKSMDTGAILTNIGGVRGVDETSAKMTLKKLTTMLSNVESALNETKSAIADSGFVGGSQQTNLNNSIESIRKSVRTNTSTISEQTTKLIDKTIADYGSIASEASNAFSGQ